MKTFLYAEPATLEEALSLLQIHGDRAKLLAGGTALVILMKERLLQPEVVVGLHRVEGLSGISEMDGGGLCFGAMTPLRLLETSPQVASRYPVLAQMARQVANVRVRNAATLGGAISYGEPQTDPPCTLIALGAQAVVASAEGQRLVDLESFFKGPFETDLRPEELLMEIRVPAMPPRSAGCHLKFTIGSDENKPVANASVLVILDPSSERVESVRIVLGAAGPVPLRAKGAEALISGEKVGPKLIEAAAQKASEEADPADDLRGPKWFKRRILGVLVRRALTEAVRQT